MFFGLVKYHPTNRMLSHFIVTIGIRLSCVAQWRDDIVGEGSYFTKVNFPTSLTRIFCWLGFDAVAANLLSLPYRLGRLDFFICIAVLHHLATPGRRIAGIRAMVALLTIGGEGLIQVIFYPLTIICRCQIVSYSNGDTNALHKCLPWVCVCFVCDNNIHDSRLNLIFRERRKS